MLELYAQMLEVMEAAFRDYEAALPGAARTPRGSSFVYRFKNKSIPHAMVMKLALIQSTLRAAMVLHQHGFVAQQAMLQRVIDEANEDVIFLAHAVATNTCTPLHDRYLAAFWAEEFEDYEHLIESHQSREMVPRQKIRAYLAKIGGKDSNPSRATDVTKVLSKTYSGFVHGAAPHIMESYGGNPPHFHLRGLLDTPRIPEYAKDLWNYVFRGLASHIFVAQAFGKIALADALIKNKEHFETIAKKYKLSPSSD